MELTLVIGRLNLLPLLGVIYNIKESSDPKPANQRRTIKIDPDWLRFNERFEEGGNGWMNIGERW